MEMARRVRCSWDIVAFQVEGWSMRCPVRPSGDGVITAWVPWMAAGEAGRREARPSDGSMAGDGFLGIRRTGRPEATRGREKRREDHLVQSDQCDGASTGSPRDGRPAFHCSTSSRKRVSVAALTARRGVRLKSPSAPISTRRPCGSWRSARRKASRMTRLTRDRTAAPPLRRPMDSVSAGWRAALGLSRPTRGCCRIRTPSRGARRPPPAEGPRSDRETMSPLRPAAAEHLPPICGAHAFAEAMRALALAPVRLIRSLHSDSPV